MLLSGCGRSRDYTDGFEAGYQAGYEAATNGSAPSAGQQEVAENSPEADTSVPVIDTRPPTAA